MTDPLLFLRSTRNHRVFGELLSRFPRRPVVVTEGDSWFSYPPPNLVGGPANAIDFFERERRMNILRLESPGDEAVIMTAGAQGRLLSDVIRRDAVDLLLFSAGGNDIVGRNDLDLILRDRGPGMTWRECVREDRLERKLAQIEVAYRILLDRVAEYSRNPELVVLTHTYDLAIPSGRPSRFFHGLITAGPWMKPYMDERGILDPGDQRSIARFLIAAFADRLLELGREVDRLEVVDTRGTLGEKDWVDEIHPTRGGFRKIAARLWERARPLLPT